MTNLEASQLEYKKGKVNQRRERLETKDPHPNEKKPLRKESIFQDERKTHPRKGIPLAKVCFSENKKSKSDHQVSHFNRQKIKINNKKSMIFGFPIWQTS